MTFSTFNYYPEVVCTGGANKYISIVENILKDINDEYSLGLKNLDTANTIIYFGDRSKLKLKLLEVENKDIEEGVIESSKIILSFYEEALTFFNLFDDLREIDKRVNGEGENFWESDSGNFRPFNLGTYFGYRRMIIARLCKSNEEYPVFLEKFYSLRDKNAEKLGVPRIKADDLSNNMNIIIKYLKEHIQPLD